MKKLHMTFVTACLALLLTACGSYQSSTQVDSPAYIQIMGETNGEVVKIDGHTLGSLGAELASFDLNGRTATRIQVTPGTHLLEVYASGKLVIKRKVYVTDGNNFEVNLP